MMLPIKKCVGSIRCPDVGYMKLPTRLALAQAEYEQIDKHVGTICNAA
jgi:hypothetical protein